MAQQMRPYTQWRHDQQVHLPFASWMYYNHPQLMHAARQRLDWGDWCAKNSRKQIWWARMLGHGPQPAWLRIVRKIIT